MQLLMQTWICAPGTEYSWVSHNSVECEICPTLLHMSCAWHKTPAELISSQKHYSKTSLSGTLTKWDTSLSGTLSAGPEFSSIIL